MRILSLVIQGMLPLALGGCVASALASTAVAVATLPVKVASAAVDAATTSQAEADEKRGRALRKAEEAQGRAHREALERCRRHRPLPSDDCAAIEQQERALQTQRR